MAEFYRRGAEDAEKGEPFVTVVSVVQPCDPALRDLRVNGVVARFN